ncbi:MAG TPA: M18 family aminopeptidase [Erysipelotrichaceae bacterium]|nr:M18 family aminopeptidase [Erysipelotrichaceae bacterium]
MNKREGFVDFLNKSSSAFHAVNEVEQQLIEAGFIKLKENMTWKLENNRYYYVVRNQSSLIAFKIPEIANVKSVNIIVSHSDSPSLKIKPVADMKDEHYNRINVEIYGGALLSTWLDKPLGIAGRVTVKENGVLISRLVDFEKDMAIIPNVAIHQNKDANEGYKWNRQLDLIPIMGLKPTEDYFNSLLSKKLLIKKEDILAYDLQFYNRQKAILWGENKEFISSGKLDNLESVYTSLQAFLLGYSNNSLNVLGVFDHEEIGSRTKQGMASNFLSDVIERVFSSFYYVKSDIKAILANSFLISADNGHAVHPNHPEMYDSTNQSYLNKGVVIKTSAAQRYVSDSITIAIAKELCQRADVPYQLFANRNDSRGGATQAAAGTVHLPINMVDVGLAQLAMHSTYETAGSYDIDYMISFMLEFYNSTITVDDNRYFISQ